MTSKRAYYTAVFAGLYGTAGLALAVSVLCAGCGSVHRLPGDRGPALIVTAPLPPAVTYTPAPVATVQPVGAPIALPAGGE